MTHRTYLWLYLVLEEVRSSLEFTPQGITDVVDSIPETVEEAYEMLLNRNSNRRRRQEARKLLHLVVAARRPILLKELDVAFQLAMDNPVTSYERLALDKDDKQQFRTKIRNLCGLFVYINEKRVYLFHQTAKEFLVAKGPLTAEKSVGSKGSASESGDVWRHSFDEMCSEMMLAKVCIYYLLFSDFNGEAVESNGDVESDVGSEYDFMDYSASNWVSHFQNAKVDAENQLTALNLILCDAKSRRAQIWLSRFWSNEQRFKDLPQHYSNRHIAAMNGHREVLRLLLETQRQRLFNRQHWFNVPALGS